jgi:hypothetical protein
LRDTPEQECARAVPLIARVSASLVVADPATYLKADGDGDHLVGAAELVEDHLARDRASRSGGGEAFELR